MKILFVENHQIFVQQVSKLFLSEYHVTVASKLSEAHTCLAEENYDVILMDYDLDDGKGAEFVQELRKSGNPIRIIGVSAREEGNAALLDAGADAICSKMEFNRIRELI
jgi:DNA-binding response OmpR family regulator